MRIPEAILWSERGKVRGREGGGILRKGGEGESGDTRGGRGGGKWGMLRKGRMCVKGLRMRYGRRRGGRL